MAKHKLKKGAIAAIVIATVLVLIAAIIVIYIFVPETKGLKEPLAVSDFYNEWQSYISDEAALNKVVTVGSHDSGTLGMMPLAETQGHSIADQLKGGTRYFDIRVTEKSGDLVIFHGPIKGQKFSVVLNDIKNFIAAQPSEFLILDFQHLGDKAHGAVISAIKSTLDMTKAMKKSVLPSVENTTYGDVRANGFNYIIVWPNSAESAEEDVLYPRDSELYSPYDASFHKKTDMSQLTGHYQTYYNNYEGKGFFVLQAQRTALLIDKPSMMEKAYKPVINQYIQKLWNSDNLEKTNIVMRDFIVSDMGNVNTILRLNIAKNLIKADKLIDYTLAVGAMTVAN